MVIPSEPSIHTHTHRYIPFCNIKISQFIGIVGADAGHHEENSNSVTSLIYHALLLPPFSSYGYCFPLSFRIVCMYVCSTPVGDVDGHVCSWRVHRLGQRHESCRRRASERTSDPLNIVESIAQVEEFGDGDTCGGGDELAKDGIARLCQRRFDGVEL